MAAGSGVTAKASDASTFRDAVAVGELPPGVLAFAVSDVLKLKLAASGNGPVAETPDVEQL